MSDEVPDKNTEQNKDEARQRSLANLAPPWKPGQSGNPGGRPKGSISLTSKLRKLVQDLDPDDPNRTIADKLLAVAVEAASKGDFRFFQEIFNRIDGKVPDQLQHDISGGALSKLDDDRLREIAEGLDQDEDGIDA